MSIRDHFGTRKRRCDTLDIWDDEKDLTKSGSPYTSKKLRQSDDSGDYNNDYIAISMQPLTTPASFHTAYHSIDGETLAAELALDKKAFLAKYALYDCRYPYEYNSGHIKYAENVYEVSLIESTFFPSIERIPIFYCEFSQQRGPTMARALRNTDRERNKSVYPHLDYPEIYLLDRGYKVFFQTFARLCQPQSYVSMFHPDYSNERALYHGQNRKQKRARAERRRHHIMDNEKVRPPPFSWSE